MRLRPPDPEYLRLLLPYPEAIQKLALAARNLVLEEAPEANEFVYEVYTIADHFTFTDRPSGAFVFDFGQHMVRRRRRVPGREAECDGNPTQQDVGCCQPAEVCALALLSA